MNTKELLTLHNLVNPRNKLRGWSRSKKELEARIAQTKKETIGALAYELILAGFSDDEVLEEVRRRIPAAKTSKACIAWYKVQLRKAS